MARKPAKSGTTRRSGTNSAAAPQPAADPGADGSQERETAAWSEPWLYYTGYLFNFEYWGAVAAYYVSLQNRTEREIPLVGGSAGSAPLGEAAVRNVIMRVQAKSG